MVAAHLQRALRGLAALLGGGGDIATVGSVVLGFILGSGAGALAGGEGGEGGVVVATAAGGVGVGAEGEDGSHLC